MLSHKQSAKTVAQRRTILASLLAMPFSKILAEPFCGRFLADVPAVYDFIIVGTGVAGLTAAVMALEADPSLSVLLLEKEPFIGGTSAFCEGNWSISETSVQRALGIQDSDERYFRDLMHAGGGTNDPALVSALIRAGKAQFEWVVSHGIKPSYVGVNSGISVRRAHTFAPLEVIRLLRQKAIERGAVIQCASPAKSLLTLKTGEVVGVLVRSAGSLRRIVARRAVLLATGGFGRNRALVAQCVPNLINVPCLTAPGSTGDGIAMALAAGADLRDMDNLRASYAFIPHPESIESMTHIFYGGAVAVDKRGKRFIDESLDYTTIAEAAIDTPDAMTFLVFDEAIRQYQMKVRAVDRVIFSRLDHDELPSWVHSGETLQAAAATAGLPATHFVETIETYNRDIRETGRDSVFGRSSLDFGIGSPVPIENPPFFIVPVVPALLGTYCGIAISPETEVLHKSGGIIPGLLAAGETTGGLYGRSTIGGSHYCAAHAFGRIAGFKAASMPARRFSENEAQPTEKSGTFIEFPEKGDIS